jgi:hypothetical protein
MNNIRKVHGPYLRKDGRKHVVIVYNDDKKRTVSYPKFLIEQQLGRRLNINETIDHIDGDITNDNISNLQILNRIDHVTKDIIRNKPIELNCVFCNNVVILDTSAKQSAYNRHKRQGKAGPFCSRTCSGKYGQLVQTNKISKFEEREQIEIIHYKNRDIT